MAPKKTEEIEVSVLEVTTQKVEYCLIGQTPIILNRMSQKVLHELLMPKGRKTSAEKASNLKHNPFHEFNDSPYKIFDNKAETLIAHLATAFKKSIMGAALDMPGAKKSRIGRLMWVEGERIPIYGIPKLFMAVTRSADVNKTPDIRTRCIIPQWAAKITVEFAFPLLKEVMVSNLLATAGMTQGVGDWRTEKGSGTYGQYKLVSPNDKEFARIMKEGGRSAQIKAMEEAEPYDEESAEMLSWFVGEADKRGFGGVTEFDPLKMVG